MIIYAGIECLSTSSHEKIRCEESFQRHIPFSMGYYFKYAFENSKCFSRLYTGNNCISWFINELKNIIVIADALTSINTPINMTKDDEHRFRTASKYFICEKEFLPHEVKVRDHCHFTGKYRGCSHDYYNLNYKNINIIPVVFHNLKYDLHVFIEKIASLLEGPTKILPKTTKHYISFTKKISVCADSGIFIYDSLILFDSWHLR